VQAFEATLGVALFDRGDRTPALSDAGRALRSDARQVLRSAESLRAHANGIRSEVEGLGGAEQRLRDRAVRLGIYAPLPTGSSA
jgi:DNA-binding transcriptional LysR family regulator